MKFAPCAAIVFLGLAIAAAADDPDRFPPYDSPSFVKEVAGGQTGFFHVERQGDAWWVIDPLGRGFVPLGVDHVSFRGHWCQELGYAPYGRKNDAKYADHDAWAEETAGRLRAWGFNLLAAGCSNEVFHRGLAHTKFTAIGAMLADRGDAYNITPSEGRPCTAFPNVFHPEFVALCQRRAREFCGPSAGDPWLFGYFLDNELAWWGRGGLDTGLFDAVMRKGPDHTAKLALRDFLRDRYGGDVARFNQAWGANLESFDQMLRQDELTGTSGEPVLADKRAFLAEIAERYFGGIARAIRRADPDHMILGCRFAGGHAADVVWEAAGRHCDLLTFNYYGNVDLDRGVAVEHTDPRSGRPLAVVFEEFHRRGGRPMMITEWSFPALDSGLPCTHGAGQRFRTQAERARATEIYARTVLHMPFMLGYDYFMWVDEPALGITPAFPENTNYGLVSEDGVPYGPIVEAFSRVNREAGAIRLGETPLPQITGSERPEIHVRVPDACSEGQAAAGASPHSAFRFERKGGEYTAETAAFTLRGRVGGRSMVDRVTHRGIELGRYNAMVQKWTGHDWWIEPGKLVSVEANPGPKCLRLNLVARFEPAAPGDERVPFEIAHRLTLLPGADWFVAELLWCRNLGKGPLDIRAFFFRPESAIGGSAEGDEPASENRVPRLWGAVRGDAWIDPGAGAFWGVAAGDDDPLEVHFWLNEHGGQHPDALLKTPRALPAGAIFRPEQPACVLIVAGRGDRLAWEAAARRALEAMVPSD